MRTRQRQTHLRVCRGTSSPYSSSSSSAVRGHARLHSSMPPSCCELPSVVGLQLVGKLPRHATSQHASHNSNTFLFRPLIPPASTDDTTSAGKELVKACRLNTAACYLKLEMPDKVVEICTNVLTELDSRNPKALYRRGLALETMREYAARWVTHAPAWRKY